MIYQVICFPVMQILLVLSVPPWKEIHGGLPSSPTDTSMTPSTSLPDTTELPATQKVSPYTITASTTTIINVNTNATTDRIMAATNVTTLKAVTTLPPTQSLEAKELLDEVRQKINCTSAKCSNKNRAIPKQLDIRNPCQCDSECGLLGECCPEMAPEQKGWKDSSTHVLGVQRRYWGCNYLRVKPRLMETVSMVTSCPTGHVLGGLCARDMPPEFYDYKLDLPVLDSGTGAWFQNVFCAACHGVLQRVRKQSLFFKCKNPAPVVNANAPPAKNTLSKMNVVIARAVDGAGKVVRSTLTNGRSERPKRNLQVNSSVSESAATTEKPNKRADEEKNSTSSAEEDEGNNITVFKILEEGQYKPGQLKWQSADGVVCYLYPQLGPPISPSEPQPWERPCQFIVDRCPTEWPDDEVSTLCRAYSYHVMVTEVRGTNFTIPRKMYKNPHCARCCNETRPLLCARPSSKRGAVAPPPPSLRLIMDFEWDAARAGCSSTGGVWDALHSRCQSLSEACPPATRYKAGRCVAPPTQTANATAELGGSGRRSGGGVGEGDGDVLDDNACPRITLEPQEFALENGTLRLTLVGSSYFGLRLQPGDFILLKDGRAQVCNEYTPALLPTERLQGYLTAACLSISVVCLFLHIVIHVLLPKLHNLPGKNLQALSVALLLAQLGFLVGVSPPAPPPKALCEVIAVAVHFFYLAAFAWMNVMSIDIWRTFSRPIAFSRPAEVHRHYALYAWGVPAALVVVAVIVNHTATQSRLRPGYAEAGICWFRSGEALGIYLASPITIVLVCDIVLFTITVVQLHRRQEGSRYLRRRRKAERSEICTCLTESDRTLGSSGTQRQPAATLPAVTGPRDRVRFFLYVKLFIIMGVTWLMGTLATLARWPALWYPFVVLNGLQGTFIFVMFDLKRSVLSMLWERMLGPRPPPALLRPPRTTASSSGGGSGGAAVGGGGSATTAPTAVWGRPRGGVPAVGGGGVTTGSTASSTASEAFDQVRLRILSSSGSSLSSPRTSVAASDDTELLRLSFVSGLRSFHECR